MVFRGIAVRGTTLERVWLLALGFCLTAGCVDEPRPRGYLEFMEDSIAREGTLARCNQDRAATAADPECINARRAASSAAARAEATRAERLEAESDLKREALRDRIAAQQAAAQRAEALAQEAQQAAYDAQWTQRSEYVSPPSVPRAETSRPSPSPSTWDPPAPLAAERDQLSFIEVPAITSPFAKAFAEVELPSIATPRYLEPRLEELTIPRPFRYPENE